MFKILIAEDDHELRQLFQHVLTKNGYTVVGVSNGEEALRAMDASYYDMIISDIMMPKMDGYDLLDSLRSTRFDTPVLMITAKADFEDKKRGFKLGADDYMTKPIDVNEMILRVEALLRRSKINYSSSLMIGQTKLELDTYTVLQDQHSLILPQKEFLLLYKLLSYPNKIFTRQQLMDDIWGLDTNTEERTIDVHIKRLRTRFEKTEDFQIMTVRGLGYKAVI